LSLLAIPTLKSGHGNRHKQPSAATAGARGMCIPCRRTSKSEAVKLDGYVWWWLSRSARTGVMGFRDGIGLL